MTFTVEEFHDLLELLHKQPAWRDELRRVLFSDDFGRLPKIVEELAQAQKRTEQALAELSQAQKRTEQRVEELSQAQKRTEQALAELSQAQKRTEQRVEELSQAQKRTEQRVEELAEAQKRTEQRVEELAEAQKRTEQRVEELAEAQKRTEQRVEELARFQQETRAELKATRREVGALTKMFGSTVEEEAGSILAMVLEDLGWRLLGDELYLRFDGDLDVAIRVATPDGRNLTAVVESKARLGGRDVHAFASRMESEGFRKKLEAAELPGPYRTYVFGIRVDAAAERMAKKLGVGVLTPRGEQSAPEGKLAGV